MSVGARVLRGTRVVTALALTGVTGLAAQAPAPFDTSYSREARAAFGAHNLCAGMWIVGRVYRRSPEQILDEDVRPFTLFSWEPDFVYAIDSVRHRVTVTAPGAAARTAVYTGDQGCAILPHGDTALHFRPVPVVRRLPDPRSQDWPMGDRNASASFPDVDAGALRAALDWALAQSEHRTRAIVVLFRGKIVAERYAPGWNGDTPQIGWSQGKSVTAALLGVLVAQGAIDVNDTAPIPEWHGRGDARAGLRVRDLMHMSSGLDFLYATNFGPAAFTRENKHLRVYSDGLDVFAFAVNNRLAFAPGTHWSYQNSDPLALGRIIRDRVVARRERYLAFPQRALFDRIGVRSAVLETDAWGNFILSGYDYMSARDWARFGLLHLRNGAWDGDQILPRDWTTFVTTPAPAAARESYGALFWLNRGGELEGIPRDAYWADGAMGQYTLIIPSRDVVLVRIGPSGGAPRPYLAALARRVLAALPVR